MHDHHEQEEQLDQRDDRDTVGNQLAMAVAVHVDRDGAAHRQQEHPEEHRSVEPSPVRGNLVEERLDGVRVVLDVLDRVVVHEEGAHDDERGQRHQARDQMGGPDAALNEAAGPQARARNRRHGCVAADHERREQREVAE